MRVSVIGAGVIGLTCAHELARAGHTVSVISDVPTMDTTSAVSAAIWFPYATEKSARVADWANRTLHRLTGLAGTEASGVAMREGTMVERSTQPDRSWTADVVWHRAARTDELPQAAPSGVRARLPVITIPRYLPWLAARAHALGVRFVRRRIAALNELAHEADAAVLATGLRASELVDDDTLYPIRGRVLTVANPGLTDWVVDDECPEGKRYVFPRHDDIVLGGTAETGEWDTAPDREAEAAILERATELVPALRGLPVLGSAVGLRPARPTIRLERLDGQGLPVIACYGHGGAGVTLSWGCAEHVTEIVAGIDRGDPTPVRFS